jgi:hypothetical protein
MEMYGPDMKTGKQYKNMEIKLTRSPQKYHTSCLFQRIMNGKIT